MQQDKIFLIAGGDLRQLYLAEMLSQYYSVYIVGFDKNVATSSKIKFLDNIISFDKRADFIVLPLPVSNDGVMVNCPYCKQSVPLSSLTSVISDSGIVFGGKITESTKKIFSRCGIETVDYFEREEFNVLNSIPTAEGAVQIAMEETATTIYGQKILVTGFGRITKILIKILKGLGADVTVTARKYSDLSWAEIMDCKAVHISRLDNSLEDYNIVFNTVPAVLLDKTKLEKLKETCLVIDLASKPGGVDFETAREIGIKAVWALSLPGKVAPITSGEITGNTILNIIKERGMSDG